MRHGGRRPAPVGADERTVGHRRDQRAQLLRWRRLADRVPLPPARDPALHRRSVAAAVAARRGRRGGDCCGRAGTRPRIANRYIPALGVFMPNMLSFRPKMLRTSLLGLLGVVALALALPIGALATLSEVGVIPATTPPTPPSCARS